MGEALFHRRFVSEPVRSEAYTAPRKTTSAMSPRVAAGSKTGAPGEGWEAALRVSALCWGAPQQAVKSSKGVQVGADQGAGAVSCS